MADPREMDFFEHLDELRSRLFRCLVYLNTGLCAAWLFIEPSLYTHEKKYVYIVLPSSIVLFAAGVTLCYVMAPIVFGFLLSFFHMLKMKPMLDISKYIWLLVRLLVFF